MCKIPHANGNYLISKLWTCSSICKSQTRSRFVNSSGSNDAPYASINWAIICMNSLGNCLSPVPRQAIIPTLMVGWLLIAPLRTDFNEIWIGIQQFFAQESEFENVICKMAAVLFRSQTRGTGQHLSIYRPLLVINTVNPTWKTKLSL